MFIAGWGAVRFNGPSSNTLLQVFLRQGPRLIIRTVILILPSDLVMTCSVFVLTIQRRQVMSSHHSDLIKIHKSPGLLCNVKTLIVCGASK